MTESKNINEKEIIREWVKLDEEEKIIKKKIYEIKYKKNKLEPLIKNYMGVNKLNNISINSDHCIKCENKEYYKPIKVKYISKILKKLINDEEKIKIIIDYLVKNREMMFRDNMYIDLRN